MSRFKFPTLLIAIVGFITTVIFAIVSHQVIKSEDERRLKELADHIERPIDVRLKRYEVALIHTRAHLLSSKKISLESFSSYSSAAGTLVNYPGAQGIGLTMKIDRNQLSSDDEFVFDKQKFKLWPRTKDSEDHFSIVALYPLDWRNKRAIGFNMFSEPTRRRAMLRAWETGEAALTAKVTLVQETEKDKQPGFLLYLPLYKKEVPIETAEQRRQALVGFVYAPFRSHDFMQAIVPSGTSNVDYQLYSHSVSPANLLYDNKLSNEVDPDLKVTRTINLGGQQFILTVQTLKGFTGTFRNAIPAIIVIIGFLFTTLTCFTILQLRHASERDREAKEIVETLDRIGKRVSAELDLDKLVQEITDAATQICRAQFGALFYNVTHANGEALTLYALSGAPREAFSKFPLPRNTPVFKPTFTNSGVVRSDDITKDPRYGKNAPNKGMPHGHLPVRSYLAVSVVSRSGEVLGGLFFGHKDVGVFTARDEKLMVGFAAQAAIAIDNANLYKRAQEAIHARDEFLSVCSHELKTPLTSLQLEAQINERLIRKKGDEAVTPDRFRELIETTKKQAQTLTSLVDDMLDVGRISTGRLGLQPATFEFREVIDDTLRAVQPQFQAQNVELQVIVPQERVEVNWDRLRAVQILSNLLTNALKYGNKHPVILSAEVVGPNMVITVQDRGHGIPFELHEKIFDRFERANPDKNVSGLGLGLFISRKMVEAHDGSIKVENPPEGGTRFIVVIPLFPAFLLNKTEFEHKV